MSLLDKKRARYQTSGLNVRWVPIDRVIPAIDPAEKVGYAQQLADKIKQSGRFDAIEAVESPEGFYIEDGNTRYAAAKILGMKEVPVGDVETQAGKTARSYDNASTQINVPPEIAAEINRISREMIPDEHLAGDGRPEILHITVKYGVEPDQRTLQQAIAGYKSFGVMLGKTTVFPEASDEATPVVIEVHGHEFEALHEAVAAAMGTLPDDFPYTPHITIAYVKQKEAQHYAGKDSFVGIEFTAEAVTLSMFEDGNEVDVPLKTAAKKFYHGSDTEFAPGTVLKPSKAIGYPEVNAFLEANRPAGMLPRQDSVYLTDSPGAASWWGRFVYEVIPAGKIEKNDYAWFEDLIVAEKNGELQDSQNLAGYYWSGEPHSDLWEFRVSKAKVVGFAKKASTAVMPEIPEVAPQIQQEDQPEEEEVQRDEPAVEQEEQPQPRKRKNPLLKKQPKPKPFKAPKPPAENRNFKKWFGKSKVVDSNGKPLVVYHGTTHNFEAFDPSAGNVENHYGKGSYFTDDPTDLENYATQEGPDITGRVSRRSEQILNDLERDWKEEHGDYPEHDSDEREELKTEAEKKAREEVVGNSEMGIPVYLSIKNPVVVQKNGGTYFELNIDEDGTESGSGSDLYYAMNRAASGFDMEVDKVWAKVTESSYEFNAWEFEQIVRSFGSEITDDDGNLADGQFIADVYKEMGFDGIIQDAYGSAFGPGGGGRMQMEYDTKHYIIWDPTKVKSAIGNAGKYDPMNPSITAAKNMVGPVYHGSKEKFDKFEQRPGERIIGFGVFPVQAGGFFFSDDPEYAKEFGQNVMTCYLRMNKPLIKEGEGQYNLSKKKAADVAYICEPLMSDSYTDMSGKKNYRMIELGAFATEVDDGGNWLSEVVKENGIDWSVLDNQQAVNRMKERGYDSTMVDEGNGKYSYFVVSPEQINVTNPNTKVAAMKIALNVPRLVKDFGQKFLTRVQQDRSAPAAYHAPVEGEEQIQQQATALINRISQVDPSPNKEYTAWIVGNYARGGINRWEDIQARIVPALKKFDQLKLTRKLPVEERDIMKVKGIEGLENLMEKYKEVEAVSEGQKERDVEKSFFQNGEAEIIHDDAQIKVIHPKSQKAACFFGINTRWCTAATEGRNYFDHYDKQGPLYIVLIKADNKRYQLHFQSEQFMDEKDQQIDTWDLTDSYPVLKKIFQPVVLGLMRNNANIRASFVAFVENPDTNMMLKAVDEDPSVIDRFPNAPEEVKWRAFCRRLGLSEENFDKQLQGFVVAEYKNVEEFAEDRGDDAAKWAAKISTGGETLDYDSSGYDADTVLGACTSGTIAKINDYIQFNHNKELQEWLSDNDETFPLSAKTIEQFISESDPGDLDDKLRSGWYSGEESGSQDEIVKALKNAMLGLEGSGTDYGTSIVFDTKQFWDTPVKEILSLADAQIMVQDSPDGTDLWDDVDRNRDVEILKVRQPYYGFSGFSDEACNERVADEFYVSSKEKLERAEAQKQPKKRKKQPVASLLKKADDQLKFNEFKAQLKFPLTVYRGLGATPQEIDFENVGSYWSVDEDLAQNAMRGDRNNLTLLRGQIREDAVDWEETYLQNKRFRFSEGEIYLKRGADVEVTGVKQGYGDWEAPLEKYVTAAGEKSVGNLGLAKRIMHELMPVLGVQLPEPELKIVNSPRSGFLGQDVWGIGIDQIRGIYGADNTTIHIQRSILSDENTLRRILAHELAHHADNLVNGPKLIEKWQGRDKIHYNMFRSELQRTAHGKGWKEYAQKFNAKYGADFVTEKSDETYATEEQELKPYHILLERSYDGTLSYEVSSRLSPKQKRYLDRLAQRQGKEGEYQNRITMTNDHDWVNGALIGSYSHSRPKEPEKQKKLEELWAKGQAPQPTGAAKEQDEILQKMRQVPWLNKKPKASLLDKKADVPQLQQLEHGVSKEYDRVRWIYQQFYDNGIQSMSWKDFQKKFPKEQNSPLFTKIRQNRPNITLADMDRWMEEYSAKAKEYQNYEIEHDTYQDKDTSFRDVEQLVLKINQSASAKEIIGEDPMMAEFLGQIAQGSAQSGHPAGENTVGWLRVDFIDDNWLLVDEVQSDLINAMELGKKFLAEPTLDSLMSKYKSETVKQKIRDMGVTEQSFQMSKREMLRRGYTPEKLDEMKQQLANLFKDWAEYGIASLIEIARRHGIKNVAIHTGETVAKRDPDLEADKAVMYYDQLAKGFGFKKQQLDVGDLKGNFWVRTASKRGEATTSMTVGTTDPSFPMPVLIRWEQGMRWRQVLKSVKAIVGEIAGSRVPWSQIHIWASLWDNHEAQEQGWEQEKAKGTRVMYDVLHNGTFVSVGQPIAQPLGAEVIEASHKTPPLSDTTFNEPELGTETNAYADMPEKVRGDEALPGLEELAPQMFEKESSGKLQSQLTALRPQMAAAAQEIYDAWDQGGYRSSEGGDIEFGEGGICDSIAREIGGIIASSLRNVEVTDGGQDGDDHAWTIAYRGKEVYGVDIPHTMYERGGGYSWTKVPGVTFDANDVEIFPLDIDPSEFSKEGASSSAEYHLDVLDSYKGELYCRVDASLAGERVGYVEFNEVVTHVELEDTRYYKEVEDEYGGREWERIAEIPKEVWIKMVWVDPAHRREGIATGMYEKIKQEFPGEKIVSSGTTPEGGKFREKLKERGVLAHKNALLRKKAADIPALAQSIQSAIEEAGQKVGSTDWVAWLKKEKAFLSEKTGVTDDDLLEDALSEAVVNALFRDKLAKRYDPSKGASFISYLLYVLNTRVNGDGIGYLQRETKQPEPTTKEERPGEIELTENRQDAQKFVRAFNEWLATFCNKTVLGCKASVTQKRVWLLTMVMKYGYPKRRELIGPWQKTFNLSLGSLKGYMGELKNLMSQFAQQGGAWSGAANAVSSLLAKEASYKSAMLQKRAVYGEQQNQVQHTDHQTHGLTKTLKSDPFADEMEALQKKVVPNPIIDAGRSEGQPMAKGEDQLQNQTKMNKASLAAAKPLREALEALRPVILQAVNEAWESGTEKEGEGMCYYIAASIVDELLSRNPKWGGEVVHGEDHSWAVIADRKDCYKIDIPWVHYQTKDPGWSPGWPGWKQKGDVEFKPEMIQIGPTKRPWRQKGAGQVYLLHYADASHHLGWAKDAQVRIQQHYEGSGAKTAQGLGHRGTFTVARIWDDADRKFERRLKQGGLKRWCPICHGSKQAAAMGVDAVLAEIDATYPINPLNQREHIVMVGDNPVAVVELTAHNGRLRLKGIRSIQQGKGAGSAALREITAIADKHGVEIELTASPFGDEKTRLDKDALQAWYKKNQFEDEPGYDPALGYMVRKPKSAAGAVNIDWENSMFENYKLVPEYSWHEAGDKTDEGEEIGESNWNLLVVSAFDTTKKQAGMPGKWVGSADFVLRGGRLESSNTDVDKNYWRQGIATALYQYAEGFTGFKVKPHLTQSDAGRGLWQQKDRPFGKEGAKQIPDHGDLMSGGWISEDGDFLPFSSGSEHHGEAAVRLGLVEGNYEDLYENDELNYDEVSGKTQEAMELGNVRVLGFPSVIFDAMWDNANTRKNIAACIRANKGIAEVSIEFHRPESVLKENLTPEQAIRWMKTGVEPSKLQQFRQSGGKK